MFHPAVSNSPTENELQFVDTLNCEHSQTVRLMLFAQGRRLCSDSIVIWSHFEGTRAGNFTTHENT